LITLSQSNRESVIGKEEFKKLLQDKKIRPASLADVHHTHHNRKLVKHPNTGQYFVFVKGSEE
jgi:hypothetical protein